MRYLTTGIVLLAICSLIPFVVFADFTKSAQFGTNDTDTRSVAWGDYDNDGDLDLAVGNGSYQQNYLYVNNGDGTFTEQAQFGTGYTVPIAWGDYDNDGDLDLAVGNLGQQNYLYINNGDSVIVCKDGFTATTVGPDEFRALTAGLNAEVNVTEVERSSVFCEIKRK